MQSNRVAGVIRALTPVTNPTATPSINAVAMMHEGLKIVGAPEDLIQALKDRGSYLCNAEESSADSGGNSGGYSK
jgi:hypothetical protein